jgi:hypothetical protein
MSLKKRAKKWKKHMLEKYPPEPELFISSDEFDYYDEEYAKHKLGL